MEGSVGVERQSSLDGIAMRLVLSVGDEIQTAAGVGALRLAPLVEQDRGRLCGHLLAVVGGHVDVALGVDVLGRAVLTEIDDRLIGGGVPGLVVGDGIEKEGL